MFKNLFYFLLIISLISTNVLANTKVPASDLTVVASGFSKNLPTSATNQQTVDAAVDQLNTISANPTHCNAGNYPLGIDTGGNAVGCSPVGTGSVTSVSGTAPITSTGGTTPIIGVNWTNFNANNYVNMGGINWNDAPNLNYGVNWNQVNLITKSAQTTGAGAGVLQLWNAAKTFYVNWSTNSGLNISYPLQWPGNAPAAGTIPEVMDGLGNVNWVALSGLVGGVSNWSQLQGDANLVNWQAFPNSLSGKNGINWASMTAYTSPVVFGGTVTATGSGQSYIRLFDTSGINWVALQGPSTIGANINWTLPGVDGTNGQCLETNGSKVLSFGPCSGSSGTVTSVGLSSPNSTIQVGSTPVTSSGTITADINWTNINGIAQINTGGLNWPSLNSIAKINSSGINWPNINALGPINTGGINWTDLVNGKEFGNGLNWNDVNGLAKLNSGGINWANINAIAKLNAGGVNWQNINAAADINSGGVNWTDINLHALMNNTGINWQSMTLQTQAVNWSAPMSFPQVTVKGTGNAITLPGCAAFAGDDVCIGTAGCIGYCTAGTFPSCSSCTCCQ